MTLPAKLLAVALLVAAALAAHLWDRQRAVDAAWTRGHAAGAGEVRGQWQAAVITEQTAAVHESEQRRADDAARARKSQEALDATTHQARRDRAAAAAARDDLDRLRDELAARDAAVARGGAAADDSCSAPVVDVGATERELLGHCAGALAALAAEADELKGRLSGLQAWVRGACTSQP